MRDIKDRTDLSIAIYPTNKATLYGPTERTEETPSIVYEWPDFELLERFPVTVAGIEGEEIVYFFNNPFPGPGSPGYVPGSDFAPTIERQVYFDYQGLRWGILMSSNEITTELDEAIFNRILETFIIVELE